MVASLLAHWAATAVSGAKGAALSVLLCVPPMILLEKIFPSIRGQKILRAGCATDLLYCMISPLLAIPLIRGAMGLIHRASLAVGPAHLHFDQEPLVLQIVLLVVLADFSGYWVHRFFHSAWLWRFHVVHHSSKELDWFSYVRNHPLADALGILIQSTPLMLIGFSPAATTAVSVFLAYYSKLQHANIGWNLGRWNKVIVLPRFHRWHHALSVAGKGRNLATIFPIWDLLFGTFDLPDHAEPSEFGVREHVSENFFAQLVVPFMPLRALDPKRGENENWAA